MTIHPITIDEAINDLHTFLSADLYTLFRPKIKVGEKKMYRTNILKNEKEFNEYLNAHFKILKREIKRLEKKK